MNEAPVHYSALIWGVQNLAQGYLSGPLKVFCHLSTNRTQKGLELRTLRLNPYRLSYHTTTAVFLFFLGV